jgi:signal transduction histidine kinase
MKLTEFIRDNHAPIVKEWEAFARTLHPAAEAMSNAALRDHADEILTAIVGDMEEPQAVNEQADKSKGHGEKHRMEAVGKIHASLRVEGGFKLDQLVAEYRALRGSILRLWGKGQVSDLNDVTRFNEAIDEALAEAATWYAATIEHTRDQFLGILGHDLRNPLTSIMLSAAGMRTGAVDDPHARATLRIINSAGRMERMVNDLLDLTRTRLGAGIPITRAAMDLAPLLKEVVAEFSGSQPGRELRMEVLGELQGTWDRDRIAQVVSNLIGNALQHGESKTPIHVLAAGRDDRVLLEVKNGGAPIPAAAIAAIFEPMVMGAGAENNSTHLGLGLYIAREIVTAHGGTVAVTSSKEGGTTFTVMLPRRPPAVRSQEKD